MQINYQKVHKSSPLKVKPFCFIECKVSTFFFTMLCLCLIATTIILKKQVSKTLDKYGSPSKSMILGTSSTQKAMSTLRVTNLETSLNNAKQEIQNDQIKILNFVKISQASFDVFVLAFHLFVLVTVCLALVSIIRKRGKSLKSLSCGVFAFTYLTSAVCELAFYMVLLNQYFWRVIIQHSSCNVLTVLLLITDIVILGFKILWGYLLTIGYVNYPEEIKRDCLELPL